MILNGNQRGNGRDLAIHLMKPENEFVEIHSMRGFISKSLQGAFQESLAMARATQCKQHLYSLSLSPPKSASVSNIEFEAAIDRAEKQLGLIGRPRVIVFHEKRGNDGTLRRHAHAVWSRIDAAKGKAVSMSYDRKALREVSRSLFVEHGWSMPEGLKDSRHRDIRNFSFAEWQQAKRVGKDAKAVKAIFQDSWAISDSKSALTHALLEHGYVLAQGKRGHVAVDYAGEVYPLSRWTGLKAKQVRERLGSSDNLPSVEKAHAVAAKIVTDRLKQIRNTERVVSKQKLSAAKRLKQRMETQHKGRLAALKAKQKERFEAASKEREERIRKGLLGLLDRITGRRKRTIEANALEAKQATNTDKHERQTLSDRHREALQRHLEQSREEVRHNRQTIQEIDQDLRWLEVPEEISAPKPQETKDIQQYQHHNRSRDGAEPEM